jgi:hypothetical protein
VVVFDVDRDLDHSLQQDDEMRNLDWRTTLGRREEDLFGGLAVGDDVAVTDVDGAVGEDGAEEGANDALRLIRAAHVAVADVEENHRLHLRRGGRLREEKRGGGRRHSRHSERGRRRKARLRRRRNESLG